MSKSAGLYLGKDVDPKKGTLGTRLDLDPADLVTHGLIVGMTGSGKTGLAVALIEEVLRQGVPVIAIDPKGDLGNLLLLFPDLAPGSFEPWVDEATARREGKNRAAAAADAAAAWTKGLAEWALAGQDVAVLKEARQAVIYTPGSSAGVPLNILQSLDAPAVPFESAEEDLRDEIAGMVSGLLGLVGIEADPLQSREHILLSQIIEHAWRAGRGLSLEALIPAVADPPFEKVGALPVESVFPRKDRQGLMMALNNLLASPRFESWREGQPLDIERLLRAPDGRPCLSIVYTAHLQEDERLFITAILLDKIKTWMRRQGGTSELRALIYMDEIYGYFPPHPKDPPPKRPLLTLLKQARAQGVGVVLATQNPVDLDYKGLANIGTWLVGKLQTDQDRERLRDGLLGAGMKAAEIETLLDATRKRVFLLHDVHRGRPTLLHSRFAMSYLRGPLTREEIGRLMKDRPAAPVRAAAPAAEVPPVVPGPLSHHFLSRHGGQLADPYVFVKYAVKYKGAGEVIGLRAYPLSGTQATEMLEAEPLTLAEDELAEAPPKSVRYADLPAFLATASGVKAVEKALKDRLADKLEATVWYDPITEQHARPGEDVDAFGKRLLSARPGPEEGKLREKLERKKRDLAAAERELSGRKQETWMAMGSALLRNLPGLLGGRRSISLSGAGGVLSKNRMENNAEARVEELRAEVAELDKQVTALMMVDASRFEERTVAPAKGDVKLLRYDLVWVY
jgi:Helicase HerA, central domain